MARNSKTEYAILGLLSLEPMSGYDMKSFIATSIGFFWQESYGQLYPTLKRLLDQKMVTRKVRDGKGKPDRHVYSITAAGRKHLTEWMASDTEPERIRSELLLKLFFGPVAAPEVHRKQIEALLQHQLGRLEQFKAVEQGILKEHEDGPFFPYWFSTLRFGIYLTRARVKWCRETLARLEAMDKK